LSGTSLSAIKPKPPKPFRDKSHDADPGDLDSAMDAGANYESLCAQFGGAANIEWPLRKIFGRNPDKLALAFGKAAHDRRILLDVCFGHSVEVLTHIHRNFGVPQAAEYVTEGRAASDREIFRTMMNTGIAAIFTCDGSKRRRNGQDDLVTIAREKYLGYDPELHRHVPPAVIVFPNTGSENDTRMARLAAHHNRIETYLQDHPVWVRNNVGHVLDLRIL
jgi:hypothetical protein